MAKLGFATVNLAHARVGNDLAYYPAHIKNGRPVDEQLKFTAFTNDRFGKSVMLDCTVWGVRGRRMAWILGPGIQFVATGDLNSYKGRVFEITGNDPQTQTPIYSPMRNPDTSLKMVNKIGCTIDKIEVGEPSQKLIDLEIQMGIRNADWNQPSGKATWQAMMEKRNEYIKTSWNGTSKKFGPHAWVKIPGGAETVYREGIPAEVRAQYRQTQTAVRVAPNTGVGTMADQVQAHMEGQPSPTEGVGAAPSIESPYGNLMSQIAGSETILSNSNLLSPSPTIMSTAQLV